jgi:hypothetical protein
MPGVLKDLLKRFVRVGKAPLHRAVDDAFFFGLVRVERLDRIGVIVAHHAGAPRRLLPILFRKRAHRAAIPFLRRLDRAAPILVAHVQDVVLEILELSIRRLGAFEIVLVVMQQQIAPPLGARRLLVPQRVDGDAMMIRPTAARENDRVQQRHAPRPRYERGVKLGANPLAWR